MSSNRPPTNRPRNKPPEPWRIERMVQRVPAHLGEENSFSPWLVVGAVAVVALVAGLLLFFSGFPNPVASVVPSSPTRTRTPRPTNAIVVTATPEEQINTATPTTRPTPYMVEYIVKSGDVLISIADRFNVTVDQIRDANNLDGDIIHVGDKLLIPQPTPTPKPGAIAQNTAAPPTATATETSSAFNTPTLIAFQQTQTTAQATTPTPTAGVVVYYVQSGDNLGTISKAFSTTDWT